MAPARCAPLALLLLLLAGAESRAQPGRPDAVTALTGDVVKLPVDRTLQRKLDGAREYIGEHRWTEAVRLIQAVLDSHEDALSSADKDGKPIRPVGLRREAERLLAGLPPAGMDFYRAAQEASSRKLLLQARATRDVRLLEEAARRFRFTPAGAEALELLGGVHLDRGRFGLAVDCFRRLLEPGMADAPPRRLFAAALAFRSVGDVVAQEQAWKALADQLPRAGMILNGRVLTLDDLRNELERWPLASSPEAGSLYRGDARRSGQAPGDVPLLEPTLRFDLTETERARDLLNKAVLSAPDFHALLPGGVPVAGEGSLFYRSAVGVHAVDLETGRERWRTPSPLALEGLLRDPGRSVQLQNWISQYQIAGSQGRGAPGVLFENSVLGTLACDRGRVYTVEDLALPPNPNLFMEVAPGRKAPLGPMRSLVGHNRLRALDVHSGRIAWEIGGEATAAPEPLAGGYFLGPPLPLGDRLLVPLEKNSAIYLLSLDPERGTLLHAQKLATLLRSKLLLDVPRRTQAVHLACDGGVLICSTHGGVVVALDPLTLDLRWAHIYRDRPAANPPEGAPLFDPETYHAGWKASVALVHRGKVLFTAPDCDELRCLDLRDGSLLWKAPRHEDDLYLAGVFDDKVLLIGRASCRTLSLERGQALWQHPTGAPSGHGAAVGMLYYLPLRDGAVLALNLSAPRLSVRLENRGGPVPGNLVFAGAGLWSQTALSLTAYPQLGPTLRKLDERLTKEPNDLVARAERGTLRLNRGEVAEAAADLHAALHQQPQGAGAERLRERLYEALTQLLQRDFAAGEKYLEEYRSLCRPVISSGARPEQRRRAEEERRRRTIRYYTVLAQGREGEGRIEEALAAYRALLDEASPGDLLPSPLDPSLRVRTDVWVSGRIADLAARCGPQQRRRLLERIERDARDAQAGSAETGRFLALYGGLTGDLAHPVLHVRFAQAEQALAHYDSHQAASILLELSTLETQAESNDLVAAILALRARVLLHFGLLEDAAACYRRLGREFADFTLPSGRTGAAALAEAGRDKRMLAYLQAPPPAWEGRAYRAVEQAGVFPEPPLVAFSFEGAALEWQNGAVVFKVESPGGRGGAAPAPFVPPLALKRGMRFLVQAGAEPRLSVSHGDGTTAWSTPLSLGPAGRRIDEAYCQVYGPLAFLVLGPTLAAVDLADRRVRWTCTPSEAQPPNGFVSVRIAPGGVYLQGRDGLTALDPLDGRVRWTRSDIIGGATLFGDERRLFLAASNGDGVVRGARALRTADGVAVAVPDFAECFSARSALLGRSILWLESGANRQPILRLRDLDSGRDVWEKEYAEKTILLDSMIPGVIAAASPEGLVEMTDLTQRKVIARLQIDKEYMNKVRSAALLADRERVYVACSESEANNASQPNFNASVGLTVPVNGRLYAFRRSGERLWYKEMPRQALLLERFDELPVVLASARWTRNGAGRGGPVEVVGLRTIDKLTGKLCLNREWILTGDFYHTFLVEPRTGAIDLVGATSKVRHLPVDR